MRAAISSLPLLHDVARSRGLGSRGDLILGYRDHRWADARDFGGLVEVEEPVVETDVAPHAAFLRLLGKTTDSGMPLAMHGAVHLVAEKPRAAHAGAERLVGEPVAIAPDDILVHVVGQRIETGTANPAIDVICGVREALGASWDEVLCGLGKSSGD